MVQIRKRTQEDLQACVAVLCHVHAQVGYPVRGVEDATQFLSSPSLVAWVAEEQGEIVGHICITAADKSDAAVALWIDQNGDSESIAELSRLFVSPSSQHTGVAVALLHEAETWAASQNLRLILLALDLPTLQPAIRFYTRAGWVNYGHTFSTNSKDGKTRPAQCFASPKSLAASAKN